MDDSHRLIVDVDSLRDFAEGLRAPPSGPEWFAGATAPPTVA